MGLPSWMRPTDYSFSASSGHYFQCHYVKRGMVRGEGGWLRGGVRSGV